MTHGYATQARCFHVKYTHRYILYTHTTMRYRCEILNHGIDGYEVWLHGRNQGRSGVRSVFTKKTSSKIPQMPGTSFPSINGLNITEFGVFKLLDKIDVSKASGPDCIPGRILQNLARELAPVLHYIFDQSLNSGDLPNGLLQMLHPFLKKGSNFYRQ